MTAPESKPRAFPGARWWKFDLLDCRRAVSSARQDFLQRALAGNRFVRIAVHRYGDDSKVIERSMREALNVLDDRFATDILVEDEDGTKGIYDLVVRQMRENKRRRQIIVVTHNPNIVVNGDAEMLHALDFQSGQCIVTQSGSLQDPAMREEVCRIMEGGREAFERRYRRLGRE